LFRAAGATGAPLRPCGASRSIVNEQTIKRGNHEDSFDCYLCDRSADGRRLRADLDHYDHDGLDQTTLPKVKQYITTHKMSAPAPSGVSLSVGAELPQSVTLHDFGSDVGVSKYKYVVINDRAAIVDPQSRKVVQIIETQ